MKIHFHYIYNVFTLRFNLYDHKSYERSTVNDRNDHHICLNCTYILSPAEDALASVIIFITFISSRLNFTVLLPIVVLAVVFTIQSINQSWIYIAHKRKASNALVR